MESYKFEYRDGSVIEFKEAQLPVVRATRTATSIILDSTINSGKSCYVYMRDEDYQKVHNYDKGKRPDDGTVFGVILYGGHKGLPSGTIMPCVYSEKHRNCIGKIMDIVSPLQVHMPSAPVSFKNKLAKLKKNKEEDADIPAV